MKLGRTLKDESGQAMLLTLLCMTCLLGFVGFAADVGTLFYAKRNLQIAADGAAMAGAAELNYGDMTAAADAAAAQNGVVIGTNGGAVLVNSPPTKGAYAGLSGGYVEAIVSQREPTFFMKIFNITSQTVAARAVAYNGGSGNTCIYILNDSVNSAMNLQGSFDVSAPKCGVMINSNSASALNITGGGGTLTAESVGITGGTNGKTGNITPAPVTGIAQVSDPYASLVAPTPMGCITPPHGTLTGTVSAGCYSAPGGGTLTISNAILGAGTYVLEGNVNLTGSVTSGVGGTTLDIVNGALTEGTNTVLSLAAPLPGTGPYGGIAIMEPAPNANQILFDFGSSSGSIDGIIYAPDAALVLHDSGGNNGGGDNGGGGNGGGGNWGGGNWGGDNGGGGNGGGGNWGGNNWGSNNRGRNNRGGNNRGGSNRGGNNGGGLQLITDLIVNTLDDQTATLGITSYSQTVSNSPLSKVALVE